MFKGKFTCIGRFRIFFRLGLAHNSLENYYTTMFAMVQHHKWSLTELEDMLPYERDIYVAMLTSWIRDENERTQQAQQG
jgi:hypothetical protein